MGTPQIACPSLEALNKIDDYDVVGVFTQPDRPTGRGKKIQSSAIKHLAQSLGLNVFQPISLKSAAIEQTISSLDLDLIVVMAYGRILPQKVLDLPRFGALNIHASILPRHRGAAPIQWAIIDGDNETGVSLMKMDAGMDTGDVISTMAIPIKEADSAVELTKRISHLGASILERDLSKYISGELIPQRQNESLATYASKIDKEKVKHLCKITHLDYFINSLQDGYETNMGQNGNRLSGGQRQRVALARALYKNKPFVILDESTSELDQSNESKVIKNSTACKSLKFGTLSKKLCSAVEPKSSIYLFWIKVLKFV